MALVLVAEDGSGLSTANSLISYANAVIYYERVPISWVNAAAWAAANQSAREQVLVMATTLVKNAYAWSGTKKTSTQALPFPRVSIYDESGFYVPDTSVPESVQFGVAELAGYLLVSNRTQEAKTKGVKEMTVDVIKFVFDKYDRASVFPESVQSFFSQFGAPSGGCSAKIAQRF